MMTGLFAKRCPSVTRPLESTVLIMVGFLFPNDRSETHKGQVGKSQTRMFCARIPTVFLLGPPSSSPMHPAKRIDQRINFVHGVVMAEADADETAAFSETEPLDQRNRVEMAVPDENILDIKIAGNLLG